MGNPAAPPLAIIFMNYIESQILQNDSTIKIFVRYIDDCFVIANDDPIAVLNRANCLHPNIKFTIETSINGTLPFLDILVSTHNNRLQCSLYTKPLHSGTCLPFSSSCPIERKKALVKSEHLCAIRNSSSNQQKEGIKIVSERFLNNGYPAQFLHKVMETQQRESTTDRQEPITFLKLPYLGEKHKVRIKSVLKRTNLMGKIRLIFQTEAPLSEQFKPAKEQLLCKANCATCPTAIKKDMCMRKFAVYHIQCLHCQCVYIGETERTVGTRIKEHLGRDLNSKVVKHMKKCCPADPDNIAWKILSFHRSPSNRKTAESLHRLKETAQFIEGCESREILPFLS